MIRMFDVEWTGRYPCLCSGEWIIKKNGVDVSNVIPEDLRRNPMNTYGEFSEWHFTEDWDEEWEYYFDGDELADWLEANPWVSAICDTEDEKAELYHAINCEDWRHGSCGGCI